MLANYRRSYPIKRQQLQKQEIVESQRIVVNMLRTIINKTCVDEGAIQYSMTFVLEKSTTKHELHAGPCKELREESSNVARVDV